MVTFVSVNADADAQCEWARIRWVSWVRLEPVSISKGYLKPQLQAVL